MKRIYLLALPALAIALAGCAKKEQPLQGQRFGVRTPLEATLPDENGVAAVDGVFISNRSVGFKMPAQKNSTSWTHRNGNARHAVQHPALGSSLTHLWSTPIGAGNSKRYRVTSDPIVADGRVYTLDAKSTVMAHATNGGLLWARTLKTANDKFDEASGGGLAYGEGLLFVTTGFGELTAVNPANGQTVWVQELGASISAPPMVSGGLVYVVSDDSVAWALNVKNGRIKWQQQSARADASLIGGAAPAISGRQALIPFSSGEVVSTLISNGLRMWSVAVSGSRRGQARSNIGDITGDPVVSNGVVYVANQSGRLIAARASNGERLWTATEGSYSPVWPASGSVFVVTDAAQLVRLDGRNGSVIWANDLPGYVKDKTRRDAYNHFGPILAGGRLIVASSDGFLRSYDPASGNLLSQVEVPKGAASSPAVVGGVLYVLSSDGKLHAFK